MSTNEASSHIFVGLKSTTTRVTMAGTRMQRWFPATSYPLIVSAPMDFVTNPRFATEVTKAGGLGQ